MPERDYSDWVRHYDNLMWTVTAILLAANGVLLVQCSERDKFSVGLACGGLFLTFVTVYFAASMRELRHRFQRELDNHTRKLISEGRRLYQWWAFVAVFLALEGGWTWLLIDNDAQWTALWAVVGVVLAIVTLAIAVQFNETKAAGTDT